MATLTSGTNWTATDSQTSMSQSYTFATSGKYVDRNIVHTISVPGMNVANGKSFWITPGTASGVPTFNFTVDSSGNVTITG